MQQFEDEAAALEEDATQDQHDQEEGQEQEQQQDPGPGGTPQVQIAAVSIAMVKLDLPVQAICSLTAPGKASGMHNCNGSRVALQLLRCDLVTPLPSGSTSHKPATPVVICIATCGAGPVREWGAHG